MKKIVLASSSPRRKELLEELGLIFDIVSPSFDEVIVDDNFNYDLIESFALNKAKSVADTIDVPAIVIGADTVVILNSKILGKPKDTYDAINMLKNLQGRIHQVVTSVSLIDSESGKILVESTTSNVFFNRLSEEQIVSYVHDFNPLDKAGSYGIQEVPDYFVQKIEGEYDNIMGLPTKTLIKMLNEINNL